MRNPSSVLRHLSSGFTLVEMAVVLIVIGLIIMTIFPALNASRTSGQRTLTQTNLQALMLSTAAYVQANGCLPCPTPAATIGNGFGHVHGDATATPNACGACAAPEGIAPYMSLGLPASSAKDGWGHWITMRVDPALTAAFDIVPPTKPVACTCSVPGAGNTCTPSLPGCSCSSPVNNVCAPLPAGISQQGLCASGLSAVNRIQVQTPFGASQQAAVIFVSHGAQGYGSFVASATSLDTFGHNGCRLQFPSLGEGCPQSLSCASSDGPGAAQCNASNGLQFINGSVSSSYDDMMAFADRNTLVSMLGGSSCQTVW